MIYKDTIVSLITDLGPYTFFSKGDNRGMTYIRQPCNSSNNRFVVIFSF